jgi:hypothetical protein
MAFYILNTNTLEIYQNLHFLTFSLFERSLFRQQTFLSCRNIVTITPLELIVFLFRILISLWLYSQILWASPLPLESLLLLSLVLFLYNVVIIQSISDYFDLKFSIRLNRRSTDLPILFGFNSCTWVKVWNGGSSIFEWIQHNLEIEALITLKIYSKLSFSSYKCIIYTYNQHHHYLISIFKSVFMKFRTRLAIKVALAKLLPKYQWNLLKIVTIFPFLNQTLRKVCSELK